MKEKKISRSQIEEISSDAYAKTFHNSGAEDIFRPEENFKAKSRNSKLAKEQSLKGWRKVDWLFFF